MNSKDIQEMIMQAEKDLRDLKTCQGAIKTIGAFTYTFTPTSALPHLITYADGQNAIITDAYSGVVVVFGYPSGNQQLMFNMSQAPMPITLVSTRPIISVVQA